MDWKYCRGLDGKPHPDYAGSARFLRIVLPVLTVILLGLLLWLARFPDLKGTVLPFDPVCASFVLERIFDPGRFLVYGKVPDRSRRYGTEMAVGETHGPPGKHPGRPDL